MTPPLYLYLNMTPHLTSACVVSLPSAAGERTSQHATVPAADHLQPVESHRPVGGARQTVQPGDHEDHREIRPGETPGVLTEDVGPAVPVFEPCASVSGRGGRSLGFDEASVTICGLHSQSSNRNSMTSIINYHRLYIRCVCEFVHQKHSWTVRVHTIL